MARIPTSGPRAAPEGKFVEMNEEIPGLDWAGSLQKGIHVFYFIFFWTGAETWFGRVRCKDFLLINLPRSRLLKLKFFLIMKSILIVFTTSSRRNGQSLLCDSITLSIYL